MGVTYSLKLNRCKIQELPVIKIFEKMSVLANNFNGMTALNSVFCFIVGYYPTGQLKIRFFVHNRSAPALHVLSEGLRITELKSVEQTSYYCR